MIESLCRWIESIHRWRDESNRSIQLIHQHGMWWWVTCMRTMCVCVCVSVCGEKKNRDKNVCVLCGAKSNHIHLNLMGRGGVWIQDRFGFLWLVCFLAVFSLIQIKWWGSHTHTYKHIYIYVRDL
jgi:hypothetical protein